MTAGYQPLAALAVDEATFQAQVVELEPLLGPLPSLDLTGIDWVVVGGESGPGARPINPDWVRDIRDRCTAAGVAFHFKQWGNWLPVEVFDAPDYSGGRAFRHPKGGTSAASLRESSPGAFRPGEYRPMRPGDVTQGGVTMLDLDTVAVNVGKKAAGRELDGRTWDEFPAVGLMSNGRSYRRGRRRQGVRVGGQRVHTNEKVATMTAIAADPDGVELAKRKTHDQLIATLGTARRSGISWMVTPVRDLTDEQRATLRNEPGDSMVGGRAATAEEVERVNRGPAVWVVVSNSVRTDVLARTLGS